MNNNSQSLLPLILAKGLTKTYQTNSVIFHAIQSVDLVLHKGESLAIMGPSGSGKSTLLHLLGCLDSPTEGHYFLSGQDVSRLNDKELSLLRAKNIGFVFQSFNLIPQLTVYENIEVPFSYQNQILEKNDIQRQVLEAIDKVKMNHRLHHVPSQLSGGELQRVAIARALAIQPMMILADEPTGNLDSHTGQTILELFQELNAQGTTLIVVTHDLKVAGCCQRVVHMQDGRLL